MSIIWLEAMKNMTKMKLGIKNMINSESLNEVEKYKIELVWDCQEMMLKNNLILRDLDRVCDKKMYYFEMGKNCGIIEVINMIQTYPENKGLD